MQNDTEDAAVNGTLNYSVYLDDAGPILSRTACTVSINSLVLSRTDPSVMVIIYE
jgi:hypothetical protein